MPTIPPSITAGTAGPARSSGHERPSRHSSTGGPAITVERLVRRYGDRAVVDGLSFEVRRGEVFALLGPNGAGKTTTVEIMEGYRRPSAGQVRVFGLDPVRDAQQLKPRIGVMLQEGGVANAVRPLEALELFASFYARPADPRALLKLVGLEDAARTRYRALSGGQKQRLSLALALVGRPELVFLDEPTAGMDPQARRATWEIVRGLKRDGVTVLLTTHFMEEAEQLADRVAIVDRGKLVALDAPAALGQAGGAPDELRFRAPAGLPVADLSRAAAAGGAAGPGATVGLAEIRAAREIRPGEYLLQGPISPATVAALAGWLAERGTLLAELRVGRQSLEDVFLRLTGDDSATADAAHGASAVATAPPPDGGRRLG